VGHQGKVTGRTLGLLIPLLAFVAALLVRLPGLESRPFHTDEAVNAFILDEMLSGDGYHYRLNDHHGPTLFYLAAGALRAGGITHVAQMDAWMLRLVTALAGAALVATVFLLKSTLGPAASLGTAVFLGLGAPFVYYSGIFIHETLLLLLLLGFIAAFWRWRESGGTGAAVIGGVLAGLMLATKETAAPILLLLIPVFLFGSPLSWKRRLTGFGFALLAAVVVVFLFFTNFGRQPAHALDLLAAVHQQVGRGLGDEHAHPWWTYLRWAGAPSGIGLPWSGWLISGFATAGLWFGRQNPFIRRLGIVALLLFVFQSILPYKTPWLMLAFLLPLALLAGSGAAAFGRRLPSRGLAIVTALAVVSLLGTETYARCQRHAVDPANPLAYSPSSPDLNRLQHDLDALAAASPQGHDLLVQVIAKDYWPLPWTLRRFPHTGYWSEAPAKMQPGVVLAGPETINQLPAMTTQPYELRPGIFIFLGQLSPSSSSSIPNP
jgi:uncharacterized protein (TIGR03663 family)